METSSTENWVVVAYQQMEKVNSVILRGPEEKVQEEAREWAADRHYTDWSLHKVS